MIPRKPNAGFWITVVLLAVLAAYPLSWLVVSFMNDAGMLSDRTFGIARKAYSPIAWLWTKIVGS